MINTSTLLQVALGGMIGSVLRYVMHVLISARLTTGHLPWGTLFVNILGSFVIGLVLGYSLKHIEFDQNWRLFLATGICGGFTTFSAFSAEGFQLIKQEQFSLFFIYFGASILLGLTATAVGFWLTKS